MRDTGSRELKYEEVNIKGKGAFKT
jgi:hypothetical protein